MRPSLRAGCCRVPSPTALSWSSSPNCASSSNCASRATPNYNLLRESLSSRASFMTYALRNSRSVTAGSSACQSSGKKPARMGPLMAAARPTGQAVVPTMKSCSIPELAQRMVWRDGFLRISGGPDWLQCAYGALRNTPYWKSSVYFA